MSTTIKDIAEAAGVSSATVSNVLNNKHNVSEETRHKVQGIIEQMNYRPNASAQRRLQQADQKSIGLVVKEIHNPYFADVIVGAQSAASARGYDLMIATTEGERAVENRMVQSFVSRDLSGLIINPLIDAQADLTHLFELKRRNIPFVMLEKVRGLPASLVDVDNVTAFKEATTHLIGLGHKKIVHFTGPDYSMHSSERVEGFQQAFFESPLVFSDDYLVPAGARLEEGYRAGKAYFEDVVPDERPTAVACYNDLVALGLMRALRECDIAVPREVSVLGFDDISLCDYAPVPLTSVRVPTQKMGQTAVEVLIRHMESSDQQTPEVVNLEATLTVRASTAPVGSPPEAEAAAA